MAIEKKHNKKTKKEKTHEGGNNKTTEQETQNQRHSERHREQAMKTRTGNRFSRRETTCIDAVNTEWRTKAFQPNL